MGIWRKSKLGQEDCQLCCPDRGYIYVSRANKVGPRHTDEEPVGLWPQDHCMDEGFHSQ